MAFERLDPDAKTLDRNRQRRGNADCGAALPCEIFKFYQSPVDFERRRHRIDTQIGPREWHRLACRQGGGDAARRRSIVEITEPAFGRLAADRLAPSSG